MPLVGNDDAKQFVVIFNWIKVMMVVGYSGDFNMADIASAIVAIANGHMYSLPGATSRCFFFTIAEARMQLRRVCSIKL
jgi:hypothetical protein